MGCMLRSDPMTFCDIYIQREAAFDTLSELGEMGCVQFLDMNRGVTAFNRNYMSEVCRCAEIERQLRFLDAEIRKEEIQLPPMTKLPPALPPSQLNLYETNIEKWEHDITEMADNNATLMKTYTDLTELEYVISNIGPMLGNADSRETMLKNFGADVGAESKLYITTGVIRRSRCFSFEIMLWRVSHGNVFYRQASEDKTFTDPYTGMQNRKVAFLVVCQGEQLAQRLQKVYSGFRVNKYECPKPERDRSILLGNVVVDIQDMEKILTKTKSLRCKALRTVGRNINYWAVEVKKSKAIYHTMGSFSLDITKNCLIGQCWVPNLDLPRVHNILEDCSERVGTAVPSFITKTKPLTVPPTFHRTNKFTNGFQALINAYGDSKYGELNPGLCTIITFPFLFAIMFGDFGHALLITAFGGWMVLKEKKLGGPSTNEIWNIFFGGRYIILLLGLFSMFTGFIYNDVFSRRLCLMPSHWGNYFMEADEATLKLAYIDLDPRKSLINKPYMFGIDPIWALATNKIMIENSLKMKLSIIFGVIHMMLGLVMSLLNNLYFKKYYAVFLQFIPEIVFLICIFLWLVFMIYYKWFMYAGHHAEHLNRAGCAPQILILFIDMVLLSESVPKESDCKAYMFNYQKEIQRILICISGVCVPILLFGQPVYLHLKNQSHAKSTVTSGGESTKFRSYQQKEDLEQRAPPTVAHDDHGDHGDHGDSFSDLMIHQGVNTIEYVLSTISHTASYLRLWALSLAHAQLSEMLWEMILAKLALSDTSGVGVVKLFIIFAVWATFTLSILVLMEGLSAFLHTLRLHWVEYMSKFYMGEGIRFQPFSFKVILASDSEKMAAGCKRTGEK